MHRTDRPVQPADTFHITVLHNGRRVDMSTRLEPGDTVTLLPEIDGG
jgi:molybdopterin converting factor small subunit